MTSAQVLELYRRLGRQPPTDMTAARITKYRSQSKIIDNVTFASSGEARMYQLLKLRERAGAISNLELQPWFTLLDKFTDADGVKHRAIRYRADFRYTQDGVVVVSDFKGKALQSFIDKAKLFRARYSAIRFEVWTRETLKDACR